MAGASPDHPHDQRQVGVPALGDHADVQRHGQHRGVAGALLHDDADALADDSQCVIEIWQ